MIATQSLPRSFYERKTVQVAKDLLGKFIVRGSGKDKIFAQITETEAYVGPYDLASHARFGKTKRNAVMFGPAGYTYIYLVYGMHYCFNIATEQEGYGAAVLIRSTDQSKGPGLLCKALKIDKTLNGADLTKPGPLYIIDGPKPKKILATTRVGINYAKNWKNRKLRFVLSSLK